MTQRVDISVNGMVEVMEAREVAYSLLARLFLEEPDEGFIRELSRRGAFDTFLFAEESDAVEVAARRVASALSELESLGDEGFQAVRWDYTRLFVGPERLPAPPWESAYLTEERLLFQESTLEVRRAYGKYGLVTRNYPHEADDHLGFELEFMAHLSRLAREGVAKPTEAGRPAPEQVLADQAAFLREHLQRWVPAFAADVEARASTVFYRGLACLLKSFLQADAAFIQDMQSM
ncbi:TorD/DmsD family molecular chaperone [Limnochorda pilosa]|uniref:Dehydrogenase n=1 Tax=Limnochorda pilosa TaxID=1555112 RepID=A0A0K2SHE6_LIMPI|nr:molecular chaperone TorD family protein [Limnochorda pilosa]BAS26234.1 dehydrogenase [Limnochorda pilosa]